MDWKLSTQIAGSLLLIAGLIFNYIISKRKFNRRTITGSELFRSYERSKLIPLSERLGRIVAWIFIIAGIILLIVSFA